MSQGTILLLHGFGSCPTVVKRQSPKLAAALEDLGFVIEYTQAPNLLKPEDFPFEDVHDCAKQDVYCWWHFLGSDALDVEPFEALFSQYYSRSDIVGIIGFSQGGASTTLLAHRTKFPSLKFVISYGGFPHSHSPWGAMDLSINKEITVPYLTIYGTNDTDVPPEYSLKTHNELCKGDKDVVVHNSGHSFAEDEPHVLQSVTEWVTRYA